MAAVWIVKKPPLRGTPPLSTGRKRNARPSFYIASAACARPDDERARLPSNDPLMPPQPVRSSSLRSLRFSAISASQKADYHLPPAACVAHRLTATDGIRAGQPERGHDTSGNSTALAYRQANAPSSRLVDGHGSPGANGQGGGCFFVTQRSQRRIFAAGPAGIRLAGLQGRCRNDRFHGRTGVETGCADVPAPDVHRDTGLAERDLRRPSGPRSLRAICAPPVEARTAGTGMARTGEATPSSANALSNPSTDTRATRETKC